MSKQPYRVLVQVEDPDAPGGWLTTSVHEARECASEDEAIRRFWAGFLNRPEIDIRDVATDAGTS